MWAGAPIFRGRWATLTWLWLSGFLAGDMDWGLVWSFLPDRPTTHTHWLIDITMGVLSLICLVAGLLSLDQYGRNAWFAWAPDDAEWPEGLTRDSVNRQPLFGWAAWVYNWNARLWFKP